MPANLQLTEGTGYLLIGHGTRRQAGQEQFRRLFEQFQAAMSPAVTEMAFLELADPSISQAVARLRERGVECVVTVPVLLFSAGHAEHDIPTAVEQAARESGIRLGAQTPVLQASEAVLALSAMKFRKAVCGQVDDPAVCSSRIACGECQVDYCGQAALTMIGRGSSSVHATRQMRAFTGARMRYTPVPWAQTAFIHGQFPDVNAALDAMQSSPYRLKVVQPHLLFEGLLIEQLRESVAERQRMDPENRWIITEVLGAEGGLANTLAMLARQATKIDELGSSRARA
jgi:sirohydrochlorin cobaltochelatase